MNLDHPKPSLLPPHHWRLILVGLLILTSACQGSQPAKTVDGSTQIASQAAAVAPQDTSPTQQATTQTETSPTPTASGPPISLTSPTSQPAEIEPRLDLWNLRDLHDPSIPELIIPGQGGYQLMVDWEPEKIEFLYMWAGIMDQAFDYRVIEAKDGAYTRDGNAVAAEELEALQKNILDLLNSISDLQPVQFPLETINHYDDYPRWAVELTAAGGQKLAIFSTSNGSEGYGPWNVYSNGRLFARYDGALWNPIRRLFPHERGKPMVSFFPGGGTPGATVYATAELPIGLREGFSLPLYIRDRFEYTTDPQAGEIRGTVYGRELTWGPPIESEALTGLSAIDLTQPDGKKLPCTIEPADPNNIYKAIWNFTCQVGVLQVGEPYRFPISIAMQDNPGRQFSFDGELSGLWGRPADGIQLELPPDLQLAFEGSPTALDLLKDHALFVNYIAEVVPGEGRLLAGEASLLGQTEVDGKPLRYSLVLPVIIEDGALTRWDLDRQELERFLAQVQGQALTKRLLENEPDLTLNLWYAESGKQPFIGGLIPNLPGEYSLWKEGCAGAPNWKLPQEGQPLQAFSILPNNYRYYKEKQFILFEGELFAYDLKLSPDTDKLFANVLPSELDTGEVPSFRFISTSWSWNDIGISIPAGTTPQNRAIYQDIAKNLVGEVDQRESYWVIANATLAVGEDGILKVVDCYAPPLLAEDGSIATYPSPDGKWTAKTFPADDKQKHGYMIVKSLDGQDEWTVSYDPDQYDRGPDGYPHPLLWTPDGKYLYYTLRPIVDRRLFNRIFSDGVGLFELNLKNGKQNQILPGSPWPIAMAVAPDGSKVAYISGEFDSPEVIAIRPLGTKSKEGAKQETIIQIPDGFFFPGAMLWSPDGKKLVFVAEEMGSERYSIFLYDPDQAELKVLNHTDARLLAPQEWSNPERILVYDYTNDIAWWLDAKNGGLYEGPEATPMP